VVIVNVLDIAAEPAFLFQVTAKLPQKTHRDSVLHAIVAGSSFLTICDRSRQVVGSTYGRVIHRSRPLKWPPSIMRAIPGFVEDLNPAID